MKYDIKNLQNAVVGSIEISESIFGLNVRQDILHRVVRWQLAKRRAGTHKTKGISDIQGTTRKPFRQKGTGRARQGSLRSPQFRGGAVIFGPVVRSHEHKLPKKVRALGLKMALSAKAQKGQLFVVDELNLATVKTKEALKLFQQMKIENGLFVDAEMINENFIRAIANIYGIDALPHQGLNVYDILRRENLVLTKAALESLEKRLS